MIQESRCFPPRSSDAGADAIDVVSVVECSVQTMIAPPMRESRRPCVSLVILVSLALALVLSVPALLLVHGGRPVSSLLAEDPQAEASSGVLSEPMSQDPQAEDAWDLLVQGDLQEDRVFLANRKKAREAAAEAAAEVAETARLAAEAAAEAEAETARLAAEAKAEAEAKAAEESRLAAEAAAEAEAETARLAAEAAAEAKAETARLAAEAVETARLAAEAAEMTRLADEAAETARLAAEAEDEAEAETARLVAEAAETARLVTEAAEMTRLAAEAAETARLAAGAAAEAEAETARLATEAAETARLAAGAEAEANAAKEARLMMARLRREPFALTTEQRLVRHPYVLAAESCSLTLAQRRAFAGEQHAVQLSDARSFALLAGHADFRPASLTGVQPPPARTAADGGASLSGTDLFQFLLEGELYAAPLLLQHAAALGFEREEQLAAYHVTAGAQAYPAYWARLALSGQRAAGAAACAINFPAWGQMCGRVRTALASGCYGNVSAAELGFLDYFAAPVAGLDHMAEAVIAQEITGRRDNDAVIAQEAVVGYADLARHVRLLQEYEVFFWDAVFAAQPPP